jgi:MFS-type transporter involved in bile tolerance (Atg22 family)
MSIVFFCMQVSWSFYSQATPAYLQAAFDYSNFDLGLFSAALGVFIAIGGTLIMPLLARVVTTKQGCMIALCSMAIGTFAGVIVQSETLFWIGLMINAASAALAFSFIITLFSSLASKAKQGWVMGITGAIIAAAWTATALLTGVLLIYSDVLAAYLASLIALLGALAVYRFDNKSLGR